MDMVKTDREIDKIRDSGRINAEVHRILQKALAPGVSGRELDELAVKTLTSLGGKPVFTELMGFPASVCISVNDQVGHGVPTDRKFLVGDIVKIDVGVAYEDMYTDAAVTWIVGTPQPNAKRLVGTTRQALIDGIAAARVGVHASNISHAIHSTVTTGGYHVVRSAFGHGVGRHLHEDPQIANFGPPGRGVRLRPGMVIAIEPVVTEGSRFTRTVEDGWTDVTVDGSMAAHFEHTVLITEGGAEILTSDGTDLAAWNSAVTDSSARRLPDSVLQHAVLGEIALRDKQEGDNERILAIAHDAMDAVLMEAWGRRVDGAEVLHPKDAWTKVLELGDQTLAGFVTCTQLGVLHVNTLVLSSEVRGYGLGKAVMDLLETYARQRGLPALELWVQENNSGAVRFYEKLGFVHTGEPYFNTLSMRKGL